MIISAETIVPDSKFEFSQDKADIPHFLVNAVVHLPKGAAPCSCPTKYSIDRGKLDAFKAIKSKEELKDYLDNFNTADYRKY